MEAHVNRELDPATVQLFLLTSPTAAASAACCSVSTTPGALEMEGHVNRELDPAIKQQLIRHGKGWRGLNNPWMAEGEGSEEFQYINLVVNPERYTGYKVGLG
jgi:hypothetical protein